MEKIISQVEVAAITNAYKEILDKESHHNHVIIETESGVLRWKENKKANKFLKDNISLTVLDGRRILNHIENYIEI